MDCARYYKVIYLVFTNKTVLKHRLGGIVLSSFSGQGFAILNDSTLSIENFIRRLLRCINVICFAVTRLDPEFHSDINDIFSGNTGGRCLC